MTSRQIDSAGAAKWLSRALSMARSIPDKVNARTKRKLMDGYVVEGRKAGKNRSARVYDLPGRFVPFGPVVSLIGVNTSSTRPFWVSAPTRGITLDALPATPPYSIPFDVQTGRLAIQNSFYMLGEPLASSYKSLFSTVPTLSAEGAVQARFIRKADDPSVVVDADALTADYTAVGSLWLLVERMSAGSVPDFRLLINEQVLVDLFGLPVIQRDVSKIISLTPAMGWATTSGRRLLLVLVLSEDKAPIGETVALGFVSYQFEGGQWVAENSSVLYHDDIDEPLFQRHVRVEHGDGSVIDPLEPEQVSGFSFPCPAIAFNGETLTFVSTIRHQVDARAELPTYGLTWGVLTVTGRIRCDFNARTGVLDYEIDHVSCDAFADEPLTTSLGVDVTAQMSAPWAAPEWPVFCSVAANRDGLHQVTGLAKGVRGPLLGTLPSVDWGWRGEHTYQADVTRFIVRREYLNESGFLVVEETTIDTSDFAFRPGAAPGGDVMSISPPMVTGVEDGFGDPFPVTLIGLQRMESPFYLGNSEDRGIARIDAGASLVSTVPLPSGALFPCSTCYALAEQTDDEPVPHRSVVTYRSGGPGVYSVEVRRGDEVVTQSSGVAFDIRLGAYYMGNPNSGALYGQIPGAA